MVSMEATTTSTSLNGPHSPYLHGANKFKNFPSANAALIAKEYREACQQDSSIEHSKNSSVQYHVISSTWMNNFLTYASSPHSSQEQCEADVGVGMTSADEKKCDSSGDDYEDESDPKHPGKICNLPLLSPDLQTEMQQNSTYNLKQGLSHGKDYAVVGPNSWKVLSERFGFDYDLARSIKILSNEKAAVEIYPKQVIVGNTVRIVTLPLGGQWDIPKDIRNRDEVPVEYPSNDLYPDDSEDEADESNLHSPAYVPSSQQLALVSLNTNTNDSEMDNPPPARKKIRKMGRCGLSNLGNTCFMNSSLQCLAHTTPLRNYFLSNEYKEHLNRSNPLGTGGELAVEFAKLLHQMWGSSVNTTPTYDRYYSDNSLVVSPRNFKLTLGRHASQFIGYDQHDSQELALYLLDALHEDTNLVTNKPYVEKTEKKRDEEDEVAARRAWNEYLQRDDSRIVESFMGQVKSRVQCPNTECGRVSTTFDPYMYLSVPIPGSQDRTLEIYFVPLDANHNVRKIKVTLLKSSNISTLKEKIGEQVGVAKEDLSVAEMWKNEIYTEYKDNRDIGLLKDSDDIYAFELKSSQAIREKEEQENQSNIHNIHGPSSSDHENYFRKHDDSEIEIEVALKRDRSHNTNNRYSSSHHITTDQSFARPILMRISSRLTVFELRKVIANRLKPVMDTEQYTHDLKEYMEKQHSMSMPTSMKEDNMLSEEEFPPLPTALHVKEASSPGETLSQEEENDNDDDEEEDNHDNDNDVGNKNDSSLLEPPPTPNTDQPQSTLTMEDTTKMADDSMSCESTNHDNDPNTNTPKEDPLPPEYETGDVLILRSIPLTYSRKSFNSYNKPPARKLGSLSKEDISSHHNHHHHNLHHNNHNHPFFQYVQPNDDMESERVVDMLGPNGRVNLFWSTPLMEYFLLDKWEEMDPEPMEDEEDMIQRRKKEQEPISLQQCIENYCRKEQLEESEKWYCGSCKTHVRAWKQFHLYSAAPILIIQLKRFYFSSASHRRDKIGTFIDFPLNGLDLRDFVMNWDSEKNEEPIYDCYAVSNHYGGLGGGHYTAYAKNNGQWCYFDDSRVTEVNDEKEVVSEAAYVLYYRRRDLDDWDRTIGLPSAASVGSSSPLSSTSQSSSSPPVGELSILSSSDTNVNVDVAQVTEATVVIPRSIHSSYPPPNNMNMNDNDNDDMEDPDVDPDKEMESISSSANVTGASCGSPSSPIESGNEEEEDVDEDEEEDLYGGGDVDGDGDGDSDVPVADTVDSRSEMFE